MLSTQIRCEHSFRSTFSILNLASFRCDDIDVVQTIVLSCVGSALNEIANKNNLYRVDGSKRVSRHRLQMNAKNQTHWKLRVNALDMRNMKSLEYEKNRKKTQIQSYLTINEMI